MEQIVTLEDVVEEIVGEILDENDSKEVIQKKTGYIVMRAEGVYDVHAHASIYLPSEDLNIKMPEEHQYETVSGFVCEVFGYIPRADESIKILATNTRKVSAVRFEQINNGKAMSEAKDGTRLIPKFMKRRGNSDKLDNITYDENAFQKR
ncbi:hypothetical protein SLEP1_g55909 [Rubroshorea leprosula]|uniref:Transporter-associated domain-containing protein n=1 Tax=Rubroshorea leprosula TaxID=152421 RepID=A0AAV5MJW6_9ROSI|nr:hypothetical protein SLEP1_g55909 [Rubroshorea leprosula]